MPFVDAKNPGNSYLLYKALLASPQRCPEKDEETARRVTAFCSANGYVSISRFTPAGYGADQYSCADLRSLGYINDGGAGCTSDAGLTGPPTRVAAAGDLIPAPVQSWVPDAAWQPPVTGEYDRLRLRIRGQSMSPLTGPMGCFTPRQYLLTLSAWIAAGAATSACQ
jgi:hypothetical protein